MKLIAIAVAMLAIVGCSSTPSKLERIEANEKAINDLTAQQQEDRADIETNRTAIGNMNTKIDRMFERAMIK